MPLERRNLMWLSGSSYIRYKNTCISATGSNTCSGGSDTVKTVNTADSTKQDANACVWTNYADYLKHKNIRVFTRDSANVILS